MLLATVAFHSVTGSNLAVSDLSFRGTWLPPVSIMLGLPFRFLLLKHRGFFDKFGDCLSGCEQTRHLSCFCAGVAVFTPGRNASIKIYMVPTHDRIS